MILCCGPYDEDLGFVIFNHAIDMELEFIKNNEIVVSSLNSFTYGWMHIYISWLVSHKLLYLAFCWGHQFTGLCVPNIYLLLSMLLPDQYNKIPSNIEAKLLPFQRDGVRYVRVLSLITCMPRLTARWGIICYS